MKSFKNMREDELTEIDLTNIKNALKKSGINLKGSLLTLLLGRTATELETIQRSITILKAFVESKDLD